MTRHETETVVRTWLAAAAPSNAPPTVLERVRTRRAEVRQRRWLAYLPIPRLPSVPTFLPSATSIAALVVVLVTVSIGVFVVGRSPGVGVTPSSQQGVTIEFEIREDGLLSARPGSTARGSGTFTASGELGDQGTFSEVVSVTPQGDYEIERTLTGSHGTMVVIGSATTSTEGASDVNVSGTWYLTDGGRAYPGVVAEGTMAGTHQTANGRSHETWVGEVRR